MDNLADAFISLPVILGIALFIGIVILAWLLLSPNSLERRRFRQDRRRTQVRPSLPFYDCNRVLVTEERRRVTDRRKRSFMIVTEQRQKRA